MEQQSNISADRIPKIPLGSREYVDKADLMARHLPITEDLSETLNNCIQYTREHETLAHLTKFSCSSTPRYIANFEQNKANPWVRGGFLCFVVMSKVPGISVAEIWKERNPTEHQLRERRQIQNAFKKALVCVPYSSLDVVKGNHPNNSLMGLLFAIIVTYD